MSKEIECCECGIIHTFEERIEELQQDGITTNYLCPDVKCREESYYSLN